MDYCCFFLLWICTLLPDVHAFNFDTKNYQLLQGSPETQFGYTVQQHQAGGRQWLLVGAPFEFSDGQQTGDVYRCPLDSSGNCSRLHLGRGTLYNVSERKEKMRLGMSLTSNPKDQSFVTCGPLWSHECGSSFYSTGICSRISRNFKFSNTIAPALQRCETFMDIVIVLDGSNSIYPWYEVQHFLINILQKFYIGQGQTQVGLVQYGSRVVHEFGLNDYQTVEEVVEAASNIQQRGGEETRTALGINIARQEAFQRGGRPGARKVMIVITDGESHDSLELPRVVDNSKKDNITMYTIAVLGYYNRRGINPEAFLKEIKFIASDPDDKHFFNVSDESSLKDIVDALGERIFSLEGTNSQGRRFGLQMAQAGFSSHIVQDGLLVGAVGAYDWNGAVLKETRGGKIIPSRSAYQHEFPDELQNHAAYLGYAVGSMVTARKKQLYVAGAPRFNHTGKVLIFTLKNNGHLTVLHSLLGQQIGSYFGSELTSVDLDGDGDTDILLVAAPMYYSQGWERGRVYMYKLTPQNTVVLQGVLEVSECSQNSRLGSALAPIPDMNGDGFGELVVGAPLEDDHQGAIYVFYGEQSRIQQKYKQRIPAVSLSSALRYFGWSVHGALDVNGDGLVDLAVGALGSAVTIWSRSVVQIGSRLTFEPEKVNVFNRDCHRGGKTVSCMSVSVCLSLKTRTRTKTRTKNTAGTTTIGVWYSLVLDDRRLPPRAVLDTQKKKQKLHLLPGEESCQQMSFYVQETMDYGRPIMVVMEMGLQNPDEGPVLDPEWPSVLRTELPFWNGCEQEDSCHPDLLLHTHTDLLELRQFCSVTEQATQSLCSQEGASHGSAFVVESNRRRTVVFARLENRGENAFGTKLFISFSPNLLFSSLLIKDQSDLQIECHAETSLSNQRSCNISAPFMRFKAQLSFQVEFEFSPSVFLDHIEVVMETSSEGMERTPEDNVNHLNLPLKYQADLLFTRHLDPPHFDISEHSSSPLLTDSSSSSGWLDFNLTYQIQNLGMFSVQDVLLEVEVWAITGSGNQLVNITQYSTDPAGSTHCTLPTNRAHIQDPEEDLSHIPQLNQSNSRSIAVGCRLSVSAFSSLQLSIRGKLQHHTLVTVKFRSVELLMSAYIKLDPSTAMFLQEDSTSRQMVLEISKEQLHNIPIMVILGSVLGGLVLLALLVLALWRLGFFRRRTRRDGEDQMVANGKATEDLS